MSDFDERARAAGRALRGMDVNDIEPRSAARRLQRRRLTVASATVVVLALGVAGVAALRRGDHDNVKVVTPIGTSTVPPTTSTTVFPDSSSTPHTTVAAALPFPRALVTVVDGRQVVSLSKDGRKTVYSDPHIVVAYRLSHVFVAGYDDGRVLITPKTSAETRTLAGKQIVGLGTYGGPSDLLMLSDTKPDASGNEYVYVYDTVTLTLQKTKLYSVPGARFDHVSMAGDLFVLSGLSQEGGPFVLYRHADGSFDTTLPDPVASNPGFGPISNAVISPDMRRLVLIDHGGDLVWLDVKQGVEVMRFHVSKQSYFPVISVDYDGRWVVVTRGDTRKTVARLTPPPVIYVDSYTTHPGPVEVPGVSGPTTLDRNNERQAP